MTFHRSRSGRLAEEPYGEIPYFSQNAPQSRKHGGHQRSLHLHPHDDGIGVTQDCKSEFVIDTYPLAGRGCGKL